MAAKLDSSDVGHAEISVEGITSKTWRVESCIYGIEIIAGIIEVLGGIGKHDAWGIEVSPGEIEYRASRGEVHIRQVEHGTYTAEAVTSRIEAGNGAFALRIPRIAPDAGHFEHHGGKSDATVRGSGADAGTSGTDARSFDTTACEFELGVGQVGGDVR